MASNFVDVSRVSSSSDDETEVDVPTNTTAGHPRKEITMEQITFLLGIDICENVISPNILILQTFYRELNNFVFLNNFCLDNYFVIYFHHFTKVKY